MMKTEKDLRNAKVIAMGERQPNHSPHPAWRAFIHYCAELRHGEIELLKIQDGLPVLADVVKKKVKFAP
jgi:hypothetical protein